MCPFGNCKMGSGKLKLFGLKNRDSKVRLMKIIEVKENKKQYLDLLLLADEQEDMVDRYLDNGKMYVLDDNGVKCECVITDEGNDILEIKNIATVPEYQGKGYARALIEFIVNNYREQYAILQVGTGDSPLTIPFYEKCGFVRSHIISNFFTDNYDHPIYESGIQLVDMVYLQSPCRINMFLHDIDYDKFSIEHGDTLTDPKHWDEEPFEAIVSNPPYSIKWEGSDNGTLINDPRFSPAGVLAPKSKADFAFIMHCLHWLATDGTAAIVCFPGIMYRGGAEQKIRKYLIDNNYIECIIQLPNNLFYGTSIATCIMVLKKSKVDNRTLFIDASKEFVKSTNSNKLGDGTSNNEPDNIQNILNAYINRKTEKHFTAQRIYYW